MVALGVDAGRGVVPAAAAAVAGVSGVVLRSTADVDDASGLVTTATDCAPTTALSDLYTLLDAVLSALLCFTPSDCDSERF